MSETTELVVVGLAVGLAAAIAATQAGLGCVVLDRRTIVSTIERYPLQMTFFHAGAHRDRRHPVHRQPREAHPG